MKLSRMKDYLRSPVDSSWVNFDGHPDGSAMDLGFFTGEPINQPILASSDALVLEVSYDENGGGNLIVLGSEYSTTHDVWYSNQHMESKAIVSEGSTVTIGQMLGRMGNTGKSHGNHDHVRLSIVPKGTPFTWANFDKYRTNPLNYIYAYADQYVRGMQQKPNAPFKFGDEGSVNPPQGALIAQSGYFTSTNKDGSNIRLNPSRDAQRVDGLPYGEKIEYTHFIDNDDIRWVKTSKGYIARKKLDDSEYFGDAEFKDQPKLNVFGQNVFRFSVIEFTQIFKTKNGTETIPLENGKGSVAWVNENALNPYEVWKNNKFWGYVRPENTK